MKYQALFPVDGFRMHSRDSVCIEKKRPCREDSLLQDPPVVVQIRLIGSENRCRVKNNFLGLAGQVQRRIHREGPCICAVPP